jgi:hypothetical protein
LPFALSVSGAVRICGGKGAAGPRADQHSSCTMPAASLHEAADALGGRFSCATSDQRLWRHQSHWSCALLLATFPVLLLVGLGVVVNVPLSVFVFA